jgi:hypothetical protein
VQALKVILLLEDTLLWIVGLGIALQRIGKSDPKVNHRPELPEVIFCSKTAMPEKPRRLVHTFW